MTAKPDPASVAVWARVILDDPDLTPADLLAEDERMWRALSLAAAEVKFWEALASLDRFERGVEVPSEIALEFKGFQQTIAEDLAEPGTTKREYRAGLSLLKRLGKVISNETVPYGNRYRLLRRYLRETRAQRRRAFQAWLACIEETQEIQEAA